MGFGIAVPVVLGSVAINLLELFVAFLQAFIFTFLTTLFIGMSVVLPPRRARMPRRARTNFGFDSPCPQLRGDAGHEA